MADESAAAAGVPVIAPPGMDSPEMRRQARKLGFRNCEEDHEKKDVCGALAARTDEAKPAETSSVGTQTAISLPHTMRDVLWTASSFEPMIDLDENNDQNDEISVGSGVLDLDMLNEVNEEEEVMIHGMKAHEFYAYICTLIIIFHRFEKRSEDADETNDAKLELRGANMKK